jgi:HTH-type transcriptional regulator/antitoxin HigA
MLKQTLLKQKNLSFSATLVELYEDEHYAMDLPEPIEAIKFRMDQLGLNQQNLVPFIGSKSKVSEVLNKKRPLTLSMMRSLHENLGISAEILLQKTGADFPQEAPGIKWDLFPTERDVQERLDKIPGEVKRFGRRKYAELLSKSAVQAADTIEACFRENSGNRTNTKTDMYALNAWCIRVMSLTYNKKLNQKV